MEEEYKRDGNDSSLLSGGLERLLSNPDLLRRVGEIVNSVGGSTSNDGRPREDGLQKDERNASLSGQTKNSGLSPGSDGLSSLLSNPALMAELPRMMAMLKPMLSSLSPSPQGLREGEKSPSECRDNLLLSLKPFLSEPRREAVDSILRIAKLGALLGQLK